MSRSPTRRAARTPSSRVDLPIITAEETDWGMLRFGKRATGKVRHTLHYAPNVTRVIVPPLAGMDGVGGWPEIYFSFTPVDDENHLWLITSHVEVTGKDLTAYRKKRRDYERKLAAGADPRAMSHSI